MLNWEYTKAVAKMLLLKNTESGISTIKSIDNGVTSYEEAIALDTKDKWSDMEEQIDKQTGKHTCRKVWGWKYAYLHAVQNFATWEKLKNLENVKFMFIDDNFNIEPRSLSLYVYPKECFYYKLQEYYLSKLQIMTCKPNDPLKDGQLEWLLALIASQQGVKIKEQALAMSKEEAKTKYMEQRDKNRIEYEEFLELTQGFDGEDWDYSSDPENWTYTKNQQNSTEEKQSNQRNGKNNKRNHPDLKNISDNIKEFLDEATKKGYLIECEKTNRTTFCFPYGCKLGKDDFSGLCQKHKTTPDKVLKTGLISNREGKIFKDLNQLYKEYFRRKQ